MIFADNINTYGLETYKSDRADMFSIYIPKETSVGYVHNYLEQEYVVIKEKIMDEDHKNVLLQRIRWAQDWYSKQIGVPNTRGWAIFMTPTIAITLEPNLKLKQFIYYVDKKFLITPLMYEA